MLEVRVVLRLAHICGTVGEHREKENHGRSNDDAETDVHPPHGSPSAFALRAQARQAAYSDKLVEIKILHQNSTARTP